MMLFFSKPALARSGAAYGIKEIRNLSKSIAQDRDHDPQDAARVHGAGRADARRAGDLAAAAHQQILDHRRAWPEAMGDRLALACTCLTKTLDYVRSAFQHAQQQTLEALLHTIAIHHPKQNGTGTRRDRIQVSDAPGPFLTSPSSTSQVTLLSRLTGGSAR